MIAASGMQQGQKRFLRQFLGTLAAGNSSPIEPINPLAMPGEQFLKRDLIPFAKLQHQLLVRHRVAGLGEGGHGCATAPSKLKQKDFIATSLLPLTVMSRAAEKFLKNERFGRRRVRKAG